MFPNLYLNSIDESAMELLRNFYNPLKAGKLCRLIYMWVEWYQPRQIVPCHHPQYLFLFQPGLIFQSKNFATSQIYNR